VISGGDPLYRPDIFEILEFARKGKNLPARKPLHLGIMTRGLYFNKNKGYSLPLMEEMAANLAKWSKWIQISMDTFEHGSGDTNLTKAVRSVKLLWSEFEQKKRRMDMEICFTIHKGNIEEVCRIPQNIRKLRIPEKIPVRLKFAHSKTAVASFLCKQQDLYKLRLLMRHFAEGLNLDVNSKYLWNMMYSDMAIRDIANGHPVETQLRGCEKRGDKCYVQDLICTIDADGQIYPCCYLLDDTAKTVASNPIGSLLDATGSVLSFEQNPNKLKEIWQGRNESCELPVKLNVCARCTRHLHQNKFLNRIQRILDEGSPLGIAEKLKNALDHKIEVDGYQWCKRTSEYFWL
jgi:MoaA/NifB/PqqE/SkfB family radical SAM enzyme